MKALRRFFICLFTAVVLTATYSTYRASPLSPPRPPAAQGPPPDPALTPRRPAAYPAFERPSTTASSRRRAPDRYVRLRGVAPSRADIPDVRVAGVDCSRLFLGLPYEQEVAVKIKKSELTPTDLVRSAADCARFRSARRYATGPLVREEAELPIAFSLLLFRDAGQAERLLRAIYRPHNYYCIHVDAKSSAAVRDAMAAVAACFPNVFLASRSVNVVWAEYTVLEPELVCMADLWKYKKWRYFINLTGQEWPLKTNWDLVRILKSYNGANDIEGSVKRRDPERTQFIFSGGALGARKSGNPVDVTLSHGSVHIAAHRRFVDYVLHNATAQRFLGWINDTWIPDETFFPSLNHSPHLGVPGAYLGEPETHPMTKPFLARFKNWGSWPFEFDCHGQWVKQICILGVGDLPLLASRDEMFANKFYLNYEPAALDCLEELHYNRTREQAAGLMTLDTAYYRHVSFALYHVP